MFLAPSKSRERANIWNMGLSNNDLIQIKIKMPYPSQEHPASSKVPKEDSMDIDVLYTFKIKTEPKFRIWMYQRPETISKSTSRCQIQWETSSVLQSPKSGHKEHGYSLHRINKDRESKVGSRVYQRPVTIYKSRLRCQTPVRNIQHPPNPQIRT